MDRFVLDTMREHFAAIAWLVGDEKPESSGGMGAGLEYLLNENAVERAYLFITRQKAFGTEARIILLKFFSELFARSVQPVLIHEQILRPLNRLLRSCEGVDSKELCDAVVCVVHRLCMMIQQTNSLLDLFFTDSKVQQQSKFFVFTQLIPHMHSSGDAGKMARDGLLLCVSLAAQLSTSDLGAFITSDSNFCQVLATGLSALYSELPTSVEIVVDEWQSPLPVIEASVPQLRRFIQSLDFCNSVLQVAPKVVRCSVLTLVKEGFLAQVLGPALLQSSVESATFATAYLTIFIKHITNPQLMRAFLSYLFMDDCDGRSVLKTLIESVESTDTKLCCVAMELFYSVVDLCCEDVMLLLVLKYLLTGAHVMPNQLKSIALSDVYCQAAKQYLQLIPVACLNAEALYLDTVKRAHSPDSGRVASPPPSTTSSSPTPSLTIERLSTPSIPTITGPASTNPFDVPPPPPSSSSGRPRSGSNSSCSSHTSLSSVTNPTPTTTISQAHSADEVQRLVFEHVPLEVAYFAALEEAQGAIETCASRCRGWSSRYDMCTGGPGHPRKEAEGVGKGGGDLDGNHDYGSVFRSRSATLSQTGRMQNESRLHPSMNGNHGDGGGPLARTSSFSRSSGVSPVRTRKLAELKFDEDKAGPFLKVLFERLMNMLTQLPAVNLVLTRLVARLAHYPQPLLRSLLLNHQLVLVSGVPNLFTVLQSIKVSIDSSWRSEEGLEVRLCRARKTMVYWSKVRNEQVEESIGAQIVAEARQLKKQSSIASGLVEEGQKTKAPAASGQEDKGPVIATGSPKLQRAGKKKKKASTNSLFAMIIFQEFLRELATISQQHASLYPCLLTLKSDQIDF
eukprot:Em0022g176a